MTGRLRFLGPEWLEALSEAAGAVDLPEDVRFTLQQVVTGAGGDGADDVRYQLVAGEGRLAVVPGAAPAPDVTLTQSYAVAAALSRADINAQQALAAGLLKVSGNVDLLVRHARVLAGVSDAFGPLRELTEY